MGIFITRGLRAFRDVVESCESRFSQVGITVGFMEATPMRVHDLFVPGNMIYRLRSVSFEMQIFMIPSLTSAILFYCFLQ